ncbi:DUF3253 domain-containing protein [Sphingomonas oryzagri]|uniref:DUF3253 domain-containing protein n=1 Tax=Sphingomonas oryzagri TaxID=3042314 RepID=A0ABT6N236_9SPHN|nr:DUF3253 domain-containing protein [Sphingomonas oryzagri]MDH7639360.1 DUF3253 domain-containing protein [Sphingomonas oryzagri]
MLVERRIRSAATNLLDSRPAGATICPSEIAQALADGAAPNAAGQNWRYAMPMVHSVIDQMVVEGLVRLSWKGVYLSARSGPYRISKAPA